MCSHVEGIRVITSLRPDLESGEREGGGGEWRDGPGEGWCV